jgi:hypothetical protein
VDGAPLEGAEVLLAEDGAEAYVENGRSEAGSDSIRTLTGRNGRFRFPPRSGDFELIVLHDSGHRTVTAEELSASAEICVESWGRVEGVLCAEGRPLPGEAIRIQPYVAPSPPKAGATKGQRGERVFGRWVRQSLRAITDAQGRFVFDRVCAGEARVMHFIRIHRASDLFSIPLQGRSAYLEVFSGQTSRVDLATKGARVAGRVEPPPGLQPAEYDWAYAEVSLRRKIALPRDLPSSREQAEADAWFAWYTDWCRSEEGKAHRRAGWSACSPVAPDGSFALLDVPQGEYQMSVTLRDLPRRHGVLQVPGPVIASTTRDIHVVEDTQTGALDVGILSLLPGDPGPQFPSFVR